jgi:3-methyladenine DNA glycosylase AlkD
MSRTDAVDRVEAELRRLGTAKRASGSKKYLKSELDFLGATVGDARRVVSELSKERSDLSRDDLIDLARALWNPPVFELRLAAVLLLQKRVRELGAGVLPVVEDFVRDSKTWALVDPLAVDVAGPILLSDPAAEDTIERWARDPDFWVRRSALLAHLKSLRAGGELGRFGVYADEMLEEKEFFIRKAIGWVLREAGKRRPRDVTAWLGPRTHRASGVTMREAVKYLGDEEGARLMAAYRERRPADAPRAG